MQCHDENVLISILLWLHFIGIGMGMGGGVALSQVGPRLIVAPADQRELLWSFEKFFSRIGAAGLVILLITGPSILWLKFGGPRGLTWWFSAKMVFVVVAIIGVGLHEWAACGFARATKVSCR
jgi:hypothetical protein